MTAPAMLAVEAALEFLLDRARPITDTHNQHLLHARRCVLAQDIRASVDVPPCDNSAMDGYAVRSSDIQPERMLPVSQRIPAGAVPGPLAEGSVARIFTGAPLPPGADAIVMQEDCTVLDDGRVRFDAVPQPGQFVRRAGQDIALGSTALQAGEGLESAEAAQYLSELKRLYLSSDDRQALLAHGNSLPAAVGGGV